MHVDESGIHRQVWSRHTAGHRAFDHLGNLSVFYQLDLRDLKRALGIPEDEYLMARMTLAELAEQYNIPEQEIKDFVSGKLKEI